MGSYSKTVLITGCSRGGIGNALAKEFRARGLRVFATSRNTNTMQDLAALGVETFSLDVTNQNDIDVVKSKISQLTNGKLDILVNNAGIPCPVAATDLTIDIIQRVYNVNVFGAMAMVQAFVPLLITSGNGRIVQMASLAGTMPVPFSSVYNSSKAALLSFGDTLRVELAPFNIKVLNIACGSVESNIMNSIEPWHGIPEGSIYKPIEREFQIHRIDHFQDGAVPAAQLARRVVSEAMKDNPSAWFYTATNSLLCWFLSTFGPRRVYDPILSNMFGIAKLAKIRKRGATNL